MKEEGILHLHRHLRLRVVVVQTHLLLQIQIRYLHRKFKEKSFKQENKPKMRKDRGKILLKILEVWLRLEIESRSLSRNPTNDLASLPNTKLKEMR